MKAPGLIRGNLPLAAILAVQGVLLLALLAHVEDPLPFAPVSFARVLTLWLLQAAGVAVYLGLIWMLIGGRRRMRALNERLKAADLKEILLWRLPVAFVYLLALQVIYLVTKINFPLASPFVWDLAFAELDRLVFAGVDPWELTHGLLPATGTRVLDTVYVLWFLVVYPSAIVVGLRRFDDRLRLGYLTAFGFVWVVGGTVLAIWFSSAGPVYMERLTGDATFRPLFDVLATQNEESELRALRGQAMLWQGYATGIGAGGISAFPSMHCTTAFLAARLAFEWSRLVGVVLGLFSLAILVGSVHLGWHYAVDGIAGLALAMIAWPLGMWFARWWLGEGRR